jgi:hypothetical protein
MTSKEITAETGEAQKPKRQLNVSISENGIIIFQFAKLSRTAFEEYLVYIRKYNGYYPDPLRVLYDFRGAGLPGLPFIELHTQAFDGLNIPDRFRWAHLVDAPIFKQFVRVYLSRLPETNYENQIFIDEDEAIEWLMRPFEMNLI